MPCFRGMADFDWKCYYMRYANSHHLLAVPADPGECFFGEGSGRLFASHKHNTGCRGDGESRMGATVRL